VWRVAERAGIELTAGRETMGRKRVSPEQRAAVMEIERANPRATQAEIARAVGISRPSVSRIVPRRRRDVHAPRVLRRMVDMLRS
jgi:DNA-binding Lrp family transcriptional regulator